MDNTENEIMEYDTNAVVVLNGSYSNSQDNLSNMGCNNKFQEFEGKFNMLDTKYNNVLDKGKAYDNEANQTNNVKNNNLISDKHKSINSKNILSDAFANIKKDEEQIFLDFNEMIRINNENNIETENADNSIWSMIGKSLDNLFTNLVGGLVPSAKAESGLPPIYSNLRKADEDFFRKIGFNVSNDGIICQKGYKYNIRNGLLTVNSKSIYVDYYIPEELYNLPSDYAGEITTRLVGMDTWTTLCGHYEETIEYQSKNKIFSIESLKSDCVLISIHKTDIPEGGKSFAEYHDMINESVMFPEGWMRPTELLKYYEEDEIGKRNGVFFSSAVASGLATESEFNTWNGRLVGFDYSQYPVTETKRGSTNDKYSLSTLNNLRTNLSKDNQVVELWKFGENNQMIDDYISALGSQYAAPTVTYNGGHSCENFFNALQDVLHNARKE